MKNASDTFDLTSYCEYLFAERFREKRSGMDLGEKLPNISVALMQADEIKYTVKDLTMWDGLNVMLVCIAIGASPLAHPNPVCRE